MGDSPRLGTRRLALFAWIFISVLYFYLSWDYIQIRLKDNELSTYLDYVVQLGGNENRPAKEVRALILVKADELGLPLRGDQILISGERQNLKIAANYEVDIYLPGLHRVLYHKNFTHNVAFHEVH